MELLFNCPRLVSPSIDVPLASVQIERSHVAHVTRDTNQQSLHRSDEIELMGKQRKPSQPPSVRAQTSKEAAAPCPPERPELSPEDAGYSSSEYSPMHGGGLAASRAAAEEEADTETGVPLLSASSGPDTEVSPEDISICLCIYLYIYAVLLRGGRGGDQLRAGLPADQQLRAARIHRVRGWRQQAAPLRGQLPLINISRASFTYLATIYNYYRQTDIKSFFIFVICDMFQRNGN